MTSPKLPGTEDQRPTRSSLSTPVDIVVNPGRAFVTIARTGAWMPALAAVALCAAGFVALATPAFLHIESLTKGAPVLTRGDVELDLWFGAFVVPVSIAGLIGAFIWVLSIVRDPGAPFGRFFALGLNCLIPSVLGNLVHALVAFVRGPASGESFRAYYSALPDTLGTLAASNNEREFVFLAHFSIFDAWSFVLVAFGISLFAGIRFNTAVIIAVALYFAYAFAPG